MQRQAEGHTRFLIAHLRAQRAKLTLLAVVLLGNVSLQLVSPLILRRFIDAVAARSTALTGLTTLAILFIGVALVAQAAAVLETSVAADVAWTATNRLRCDLARHCLSLDMSFHTAHLPGEMIERIDGDVALLANVFSRFVLQVLASLLLLVGAIVILLRVEWRIGVTFTLFALAGLAVLARMRTLAVPASHADRETSAALFGYLEERLAGTEDVRSRGAVAYVLRGLFVAMRARLRARRRAAALTTLTFGTMDIVFAVGTALAFAIGGALFHARAITLGTVYLFVTYSWLITQPLALLAQQMQDVQVAIAGIERIQRLFTTTSVIRDGPGAPLPIGPLAVVCDRVSFAYAAETPVLRDVSFTLPPGRVLGVLGRTGSGKTTVTRLLLRLYDPTDGAVRLGDVDLRATRQADVRARVGLVTQDVQLIAGSVRDNLTFYDRTIPDAHILEALRTLGLEAWYEALPAGLDTELPSGGQGLSAGEAQLLAFARVFLKNPGLVILDEASSRLDPATERLIERAIDALLRGRTGIIVAHRLATVRRADDILILDGGRIVEYGPRIALAQDPASRFARLLTVGLEGVA